MAEMVDHSVGTCAHCVWFRAAIDRMRLVGVPGSVWRASRLSRLYDKYEVHLDTHVSQRRKT